MFKRWFLIPAMVVALGITALQIDPLHAQESSGDDAGIRSAQETPSTGKRVIYVQNSEFPPNEVFVSYPPNQKRKTRFWEYLDKELAANNMRLTENMEEADYRVDLKCAGIIQCSRLQVFIESPNRDVLTSFPVEQVRLLYTPPQVPIVARRISEKLEQHLNLLEKGGYGYH